MNCHLRKILFFVGLVTVFSSFGVAKANSQGVLREILARMDRNNKALQSLKADVTMVKYDSVLKVSDTTYGSTSYLPKSKITGNKLYIRVDWTRPVEEQMSVIGDSYELYRKKLNQVIVGKTSAAKGNGKVSGALGFMNMSKAQLDANYTTTFIGEEEISGGVRTWHIELMPKTEQSYKSADLWVDGDGMPRQARVVEMNNDTTTVLLANIQKNIKLNGQIFKLDYPGNVKKIKA